MGKEAQWVTAAVLGHGRVSRGVHANGGEGGRAGAIGGSIG